MGIKGGKSYSAKDVKKALENLGYTVTKCEASTKNFLVQVSKGGADGTDHGKQGISCALDGDKCAAGGLTGTHGLQGLSKSKLEGE